MAELTFDEPRLVDALEAAYLAWIRRDKALCGLIPPEEYLIDNLPSKTSILMRAQTLFAYLRINLSGERAWSLVYQTKRIFDEAPWFIDPLMDVPAGIYCQRFTLKDHFQEIVRFTDMRPDLYDWWQRGLLVLRQPAIAGDPRNLIYRTDGSREAMITSFSKEFPGIAHKIAQLQIIGFHAWAKKYDQNLWRFFEERSEAFVAADLWWMRLMRQWDLVTAWGSDHRDRISRPISDEIVRICLERGWPYMDVCQGVWHLGAMVCGEMRPNTPKGVNNAKTALWCLRNCPMNSFCRYLVRANEGETSRGSIGWDSAKERVIALCEPQPKLFEVEVTEGVANKGNMVWGRRGRKRRNLQTHLQYE